MTALLKSPKRTAKCLCLLLVSFCLSRPTFAQSTTEAAGAASSSAGMAAGTKAPVVLAGPSSPGNSSPYITPQEGPPPEETNRKTLEGRAGKDAAKLLLRSVPSGARVYVNELFVGQSPLLLILPPGKYKVQMRGERQELGERLVGLLANDTQNLTIPLTPRYPARISVR